MKRKRPPTPEQILNWYDTMTKGWINPMADIVRLILIDYKDRKRIGLEAVRAFLIQTEKRAEKLQVEINGSKAEQIKRHGRYYVAMQDELSELEKEI